MRCEMNEWHVSLSQAPGCPDLSILSFMGGFHGRTLGMSHSYLQFLCQIINIINYETELRVSGCGDRQSCPLAIRATWCYQVWTGLNRASALTHTSCFLPSNEFKAVVLECVSHHLLWTLSLVELVLSDTGVNTMSWVGLKCECVSDRNDPVRGILFSFVFPMNGINLIDKSDTIDLMHNMLNIQLSNIFRSELIDPPPAWSELSATVWIFADHLEFWMDWMDSGPAETLKPWDWGIVVYIHG